MLLVIALEITCFPRKSILLVDPKVWIFKCDNFDYEPFISRSKVESIFKDFFSKNWEFCNELNIEQVFCYGLNTNKPHSLVGTGLTDSVVLVICYNII